MGIFSDCYKIFLLLAKRLYKIYLNILIDGWKDDNHEGLQSMGML